MFSIPNNVGMDSYKRRNKNLLHANNERHVLPSGENFVLSPVLNLQYTESSTKSLSQICETSAVPTLCLYTITSTMQCRTRTYLTCSKRISPESTTELRP